MQNRAQGAVEYLLIIGAAILIVSIVVIAISGVSTAGVDTLDPEPVNNPLKDLLISKQGYIIEIEASDVSWVKSGFETRCTSSQPSASNFYCEFPINPTGCNDETPSPNGLEKTIIYVNIADLDTGQVTIEELDLSKVNGRNSASDFKTFTITYFGDPAHKHNLKTEMHDIHYSCDEPPAGKEFDRNIRLYSATIKTKKNETLNSIADETGTCWSTNCVDLNFS